MAKSIVTMIRSRETLDMLEVDSSGLSRRIDVFLILSRNSKAVPSA